MHNLNTQLNIYDLTIHTQPFKILIRKRDEVLLCFHQFGGW